MDNISFKSTIKPVSVHNFNNLVSSYGAKRFIDYPWTIKESVLADKVYTRGIEDCTFLGITDGLKVLGMHLCPTMEENLNFKKIKNFIEDKLDLQNNAYLQGFLLGSRRYSEQNCSSKLFDYLSSLLETYQIPYSKFKGGEVPNDVAYSSQTDEWIVSGENFPNDKPKEEGSVKEFFSKIFEEVQISKYDELKW